MLDASVTFTGNYLTHNMSSTEYRRFITCASIAFFCFLGANPGNTDSGSAVTSLKPRPPLMCSVSCKHTRTSLLHRKKKEKKKKHIWKQACGSSGWRWGRQACIKQRTGQTSFSSRSYQRCVTFNTTTSQSKCIIMTILHVLNHKCVCCVDSGTAVVRAQYNRPSNQQQDRQTVW